MDYILNSINEKLSKEEAEKITVILYGKVMKLVSNYVIIIYTSYTIYYNNNMYNLYNNDSKLIK